MSVRDPATLSTIGRNSQPQAAVNHVFATFHQRNAAVSGSAVYNYDTDELDPQLSGVKIKVETVFP